MIPNPPGLNANAERRADQRYKVSFRVHLVRGETAEVESEVADLSAGGCFVESETEVRRKLLAI